MAISKLNDKNYKQTILVDSLNAFSSHPEIAEIQDMGYSIMQTALPVGDYAVMTPAFEDILRTRKIEAFCAEKFKGRKKSVDATRLDLVGTYDRAVDTKNSIDELYSNLLLIGDRYRFERELIRARNMGVSMLILISNSQFHDIDDLLQYTSPRNYDDAGLKLVQRIHELEEKYMVTFELMKPEFVSSRILEYLLMDNLWEEDSEWF